MRRRLTLLFSIVALGALIAVPAASARTTDAFSPGSGPATGGTVVSASGDFSDVSGVYFGAASARIETATTTQLQVVAPAGSGVVQVTVHRTGGSVDALGSFSYVPVVSAISPDNGSISGTLGDTDRVTLTGAGFTGATSVSFGDTAATTFSVDSDNQITADAPAGEGTVPVSVGGPGGTGVSSARYRYRLELTSLSVTSAPGSGQTQVELDGIGFAVATNVRFGSAFAGFVVVSDTQILAAAPPGDGQVSVSVETPYGTSVPLTFSYTSGGGTLAGASAGAPGAQAPGSRPPTNSDGPPTVEVPRAVHAVRTSTGTQVTVRIRIDQPATLTLWLTNRPGRKQLVAVGRGHPARTVRIRRSAAGTATVRLRLAAKGVGPRDLVHVIARVAGKSGSRLVSMDVTP